MMRNLVTIILLAFVSMPNLVAQRKVIVPEGFGTLNEIIRKDTLAGGIRKDVNTVYVLRRGSVYLLSGTILTTGFHLRLEAEEGTGPRPFVQMGFLEGGTQVEEIFEVRGDASFRGLHISAINEFNTYIARVLSASSPDIRLRFTDCIIDGSGQTFIRINSSGNSVYMLNCTVSRMGRPSNPDNGRVIDDRGNQMDSIVVENNTWYNITSRIIRDGGAEIDYVKLNQNTLVNVGQRLAAIGQVKELIFTNNIAVNSRFLGNSLTTDIVSFEFTPVGTTSIINLDFNNIYYDQEVLDAYATLTNAGVQRVLPPFVTSANQVYLENAQGIISESLQFQVRPVPPTEFILQSQLGDGSSVPDWDWTGSISGNPWEITASAYHNFSYSNTALAFTGSAKGEPLGDLRWFPQFNTAWSVDDLSDQAQALIDREANNPVIAGNLAALLELQNKLNEARATAANSGSTGLQLAVAHSDLKTAMDDFRASLIITKTTSEIKYAKIYPNPVSNRLLIETAGPADIVLFGVNGNEFLRATSSTGYFNLDIDKFDSGIYLIRISTSKGIETQKIMKL